LAENGLPKGGDPSALCGSFGGPRSARGALEQAAGNGPVKWEAEGRPIDPPHPANRRNLSVNFSEHNHADVSNPTRDYISDCLRCISPNGPGYFSLTSDDGSYVQAAGARLKLTIEYRHPDGDSFRHYILGRDDISDRSCRQINSAVGQINLFANEVLDIDDAIDVFGHFLNCGVVPDRFLLRDDTERFQYSKRDNP
jgi:hypothetical protein